MVSRLTKNSIEEQRVGYVQLTRSKVKGGRSMHKDARDTTRYMENGARDASKFVEFNATGPGRITSAEMTGSL